MHRLHQSRCGGRVRPPEWDGIGSRIQFLGLLIQFRQRQIAIVQQGLLSHLQPSFKIARPQVAGRLQAFQGGQTMVLIPWFGPAQVLTVMVVWACAETLRVAVTKAPSSSILLFLRTFLPSFRHGRQFLTL